MNYSWRRGGNDYSVFFVFGYYRSTCSFSFPNRVASDCEVDGNDGYVDDANQNEEEDL